MEKINEMHCMVSINKYLCAFRIILFTIIIYSFVTIYSFNF